MPPVSAHLALIPSFSGQWQIRPLARNALAVSHFIMLDNVWK